MSDRNSRLLKHKKRHWYLIDKHSHTNLWRKKRRKKYIQVELFKERFWYTFFKDLNTSIWSKLEWMFEMNKKKDRQRKQTLQCPMGSIRIEFVDIDLWTILDNSISTNPTWWTKQNDGKMRNHNIDNKNIRRRSAGMRTKSVCLHISNMTFILQTKETKQSIT